MRFVITKKGFTLIELLVVIVIIGILASLVFVSYTSADKQAHDTQRKNDITQYRNLLQEYAVNNLATYPNNTWDTFPGLHINDAAYTLFCKKLNLTTCFIDPADDSVPSFGGWPLGYYYLAGDGTNNTGSYVLFARLESSSTKYWVACSNGKSGICDSSAVPSCKVNSSMAGCPLP